MGGLITKIAICKMFLSFYNRVGIFHKFRKTHLPFSFFLPFFFFFAFLVCVYTMGKLEEFQIVAILGKCWVFKVSLGTSLVVQWLRLYLPMLWMQVQSLHAWYQGVKILHASQPKNQNIEQKQYRNKFNKDLKLVHIETKS